MFSQQLYLVLNLIPYVGLVFAAILLVVGILRKSKPALFTGLLVALICSSFITSMMAVGVNTYKNFTADPEQYGLVEENSAWARLYYVKSKMGVNTMYSTTLLALLGLISMQFFAKFTRFLATLALLSVILGIVVGVWVSFVEEDRYPEEMPKSELEVS